MRECGGAFLATPTLSLSLFGFKFCSHSPSPGSCSASFSNSQKGLEGDFSHSVSESQRQANTWGQELAQQLRILRLCCLDPASLLALHSGGS